MLDKYFDTFIQKFNFNYTERDFILNLKGYKNNIFILESFFYGNLFKYFVSSSFNQKMFIYEDLKYKPDQFINDLLKLFGISNIEYKNIIINSTAEDKKERNIFNRIFYRYIMNLLKIIRHVYKFKIYKSEIKRIYWNYKNYVNTRFNLSEHKILINEFYKKDFEKLPAEIKNKCSNYNYLN